MLYIYIYIHIIRARIIYYFNLKLQKLEFNRATAGSGTV